MNELIRDVKSLELETLKNLKSSKANNTLRAYKADFKDFEKALPFRKFADEINENPASLAHRYALSANKVGSVILGVKNRKELVECIEAEEKGLLDEDVISKLEKLFKNME